MLFWQYIGKDVEKQEFSKAADRNTHWYNHFINQFRIR